MSLNANTLALSLEDKALKEGALMQEFFNFSLMTILIQKFQFYFSSLAFHFCYFNFDKVSYAQLAGC